MSVVVALAVVDPAPPLQFAVTKIQPPGLRRGAVARPRLDAALAAALDDSTLVSLVAPAGFGKSVALAFQVRRLQRAGAAVAWIGAEEDDDLARLAACLIAALEPADVPWRRSPDAIAAAFDGADSGRRKALASELVNALAATDVPRGFLVLDDAHRLQDEQVFGFLQLLVERLPSHWCLVVASRIVPPMATARFRAAGLLAEFGPEDLRFDIDEVRALTGTALDSNSALGAEALLERTRGWAAGLCLALQARGSRAPLVDRHLFDYVAAEVLAQMPAAKRLFLLRCSILPELSPAICEAVSGDPQTAGWLDEIERQGLFTSGRGSGAARALVLHDLFRECLDDLLLRERPQELPALLQRAAAVEPDVTRRIGFLVRAEAWAEARRVLFEAAPTLITNGLVGHVLRLIEHLPPAQRQAPDLDMVRGLCAWANWDFTAMRLAMRRAAAAFTTAGDLPRRRWAEAHEAIALATVGQASDAALLLGGDSQREPDGLGAQPPTQPASTIVATASVDEGAAGPFDQALRDEALIARLHARAIIAVDAGPLDDACSQLESEFDIVERRPSAALWYKAVPTVRHVGLPGFWRLFERFATGTAAFEQEEPTTLSVLTAMLNGWLAVWAGHADAAEVLLAESAEKARWLAQGGVISLQTSMAQAFLQALRGQAGGALAAVRLLTLAPLSLPDGERRRRLEASFAAVELRITSVVGRPEQVVAIGERVAGQALPAAGETIIPHLRALQGHVLLARGDEAGALALWQRSLDEEEAKLRWQGLDLELRVRLAAAAVDRGQSLQAAELLRPVLARAASEQAHLPALFAGREAITTLAAHRWEETLAPAECGWLGHWQRLMQRTSDPVGSCGRGAGLGDGAGMGLDPGSGMCRPTERPAVTGSDLTARELEVLARLAAGDSNKVIARAFDLSPFTVKRHVANILDKLAVSSRGQAAAWFRARPA